MIRRDLHKRRASALARYDELERCPTCSAGRTCATHPRAVVWLILRDLAAALSAS